MSTPSEAQPPFNPDIEFAEFQRLVAEHSSPTHILTGLPERVAQVEGDDLLKHPQSGVQVAAGGPNGALLVPALTPEQVAQGISSNGKKMVPIKVPENINPHEFKRAVAAAYMQYVTEGTVTNAGVVDRSGLNEGRVALIFGAPEFKTACATRGIVTQPNPGISPEQDYALAIVLDTSDGLTFGKKLKKAGVTHAKWQAWLQNPVFAAHFQRATDNLFADSRPAMLQLVSRANDGDLGAIKFFFEVNGRHNPQQQSTMDIMVVMNRIMEVLAKNIEPAQLARIATEMREIGESVGLAQQRTIHQ